MQDRLMAENWSPGEPTSSYRSSYGLKFEKNNHLEFKTSWGLPIFEEYVVYVLQTHKETPKDHNM